MDEVPCAGIGGELASYDGKVLCDWACGDTVRGL